MTSLNAATGKDDGFIHLSISGNYQFPGVGSNPTRVYNQQLSNSGTLDLVEGDFTSVGGVPRQQIFMLDLSGSTAAVTGWTSTEFNTNCNYNEAFWLQAASWSPDDSTVYIATTGYKPNGTPAGSYPRSRAVRRGRRVPRRRRHSRHPHVDQLHRLRLDVLHRRRRRAPRTSAGTSGGRRTRTGVTSPGPARSAAPGMEGLSPSHRGADLQSHPLTRRGRR